LALSFAHPLSGLTQLRSQQAHTCCHIAFIAPCNDFLVEMQGAAFLGLASWQLAAAGTHGGRVAAEGSVRNGYVRMPHIKADIRIRFNRQINEPCPHRALAEGEMQARWFYAMPGVAGVGPFPINGT